MSSYVCVCVCVWERVCDCIQQKWIGRSVYQGGLPLYLFITSVKDTMLSCGNMHLSFPDPFHSLPPDEDSVCSQLLRHMSQLRQTCLLGFFSHYFSPVTWFAPRRCSNPIKRKLMSPLGQIKTAPYSPHAHTYTQTHTRTLTVLSAAPADLSGAYKDNSCSPIHLQW